MSADARSQIQPVKVVLPSIQIGIPLRTSAVNSLSTPEVPMAQPFSQSSSDAMNSLVRQIAVGDSAALRLLYGILCEAVGCRIRQVLADPRAAEGAIYATFVEVWWLARFHAGESADADAWISVVATHRAVERLALPGPSRYDADTPRVALAGLFGGPVPPL
jgi:hypothetical protein